MADVARAPRIQSITMAVYPGTERATALDHAISLAVAHRADVLFTHEDVDYTVRRQALHDLVLLRNRVIAPDEPVPAQGREAPKGGAGSAA